MTGVTMHICKYFTADVGAMPSHFRPVSSELVFALPLSFNTFPDFPALRSASPPVSQLVDAVLCSGRSGPRSRKSSSVCSSPGEPSILTHIPINPSCMPVRSLCWRMAETIWQISAKHLTQTHQQLSLRPALRRNSQAHAQHKHVVWSVRYMHTHPLHHTCATSKRQTRHDKTRHVPLYMCHLFAIFAVSKALCNAGVLQGSKTRQLRNLHRSSRYQNHNNNDTINTSIRTEFLNANVWQHMLWFTCYDLHVPRYVHMECARQVCPHVHKSLLFAGTLSAHVVPVHRTQDMYIISVAKSATHVFHQPQITSTSTSTYIILGRFALLNYLLGSGTWHQAWEYPYPSDLNKL